MIEVHTITIDFADGGQRTLIRTTTGAIRNFKWPEVPHSS